MIKFFHALIFLFAFALFSNAQDYSQPPVLVNAGDIIQKGIEQYDKENYDEALKNLLQVPENDTAYALALYETALTYRAMKQPKKAIELFKKGITLRSQFKRSFYEGLGSAYDEGKDFQNSVNTYYAGLKEFPTYDFFYNEMGISFWLHKDGDSAYTNLVKAVQMNPIRAVNHLKLSAFMVKNNQLVPALMALLLYSIYETNDNRLLGQLGAYEKILKKEESFSPDSALKINFNSEQFSEVEQIIKSNMAVSSDYKVPVKLTYNYLVKNFYVLMEKVQVNKSEKDIWNTFYIPILKKIYKEDKFEPFMLRMFSVVKNDDVQKQVEKKKKKIEEFAGWVTDDIYQTYMKKKTSIVEGKPVTAEHGYYANGNIKYIANYNEAVKMYNGKGYFFNKNGTFSASGEFDNAGKKIGEWKYYSEDGTVNSIVNYKTGTVDGAYMEFYPNGNLKTKGTYKDGLIEGDYFSYYAGGALQRIKPFSKGKPSGEEKLYHDNEMLKQTANVSAENLYQGELKKYFSNGNLNLESKMNKSEYDGKFKMYYENEGTLKEEGEIIDGKNTGKRISYFPDGKTLDEVDDSYKNGKLSGTRISYYKNGKISQKSSYENDLLEGETIQNDSNGNMYAKFICDKGYISKMTFFNDGKKIDEITASKKKYNYKSYQENGVLFEEGTMVDREREGTWKSYYPNGNVHKEINYSKGKYNGTVKSYHEHGTIDWETNYTDGEMDGLYKKYYENGMLKQQGWYVKGNSEGNFYNYAETGKIESNVYVFHGDRQGPMKLYDVTGKLNSIEYYDQGIIYKAESYDTLGNIVQTSENKMGTGKLSWYHPNGKLRCEIDYKNGYEHGRKKNYFSNGTVVLDCEYKNGMKTGKYNSFNIYGKPVYESNYKLDKLDSTYTHYAFDGSKHSVMHYKYGNLNGRREWFYANGKLRTEGNYRNDERHGTFNYYAPDGTLMISLNYMDGDLISYSYFDASGKMLPAKKINPKKDEVIAYYPNGKKSEQFTVELAKFNGTMKTWYPNGNQKEETGWYFGNYEGVHKEYFENGTISVDEKNKSNNLDGECKYYFDNGKLKRVTNFINDIRHGNETIFDKTGKKISSYNFYNGEIF